MSTSSRAYLQSSRWDNGIVWMSGVCYLIFEQTVKIVFLRGSTNLCSESTMYIIHFMYPHQYLMVKLKIFPFWWVILICVSVIIIGFGEFFFYMHGHLYFLFFELFIWGGDLWYFSYLYYILRILILRLLYILNIYF